MSFGALLAGIVHALAIGCAFSVAGAALQSRLAPDLPARDAVLDAFLIATALAVGCVELLGFAGMLAPWTVLGLGAVLAVAAVLVAGLPSLAAFGAHLRAMRAALRGSPAAWLLSALGVLLACRALTQVPLAWDALTYHLTYASVWIQHRGFVPFEAGGVWEQYETFPKAGEILFWLAMAPLRSDALVNLVNLPFWFGIALALRSAGQQLGAEGRTADAFALPIVLHPMFSAYVTPSYVEVQSAFYLTAAVACGLRARTDLRAVSGIVLASCLAAATKITALSWFAPLALWLLVLMRSHPPLRVLRGAATAPALLGVAIALPWYAYNALRCDNPFYPAPLPLALDGPAAGSSAMATTLVSSSIAGMRNLDHLLEVLLKLPWKVRYPQGPGLLFPWLAVAVPAVVWLARAGAPRRGALGLLAAAFFLFATYLLSPHNGQFLDANSRFLALPCALLMLSLLSARDGRSPVLIGAVWLAACAITGLALWPTDLWRLPSLAGPAGHGAVWVVAGLAAALLASALLARPSRGTAMSWCAGALLLLVAAGFSVQERERDRARDMATGYDLHPVMSDRGLWRAVGELDAARLAVAIGSYHSLDGWFLYPLFGPRLMNQVQYVDVEREASPACRRRGLLRDQPDRQAWLSRLAQRRITHFYLGGLPLERTWITADPARFELVARSAGSELYRVKCVAEACP